MNAHAHEAYTTRSLNISVSVELQCFHNLGKYVHTRLAKLVVYKVLVFGLGVFVNLEMTSNSRVNKPLVIRASAGKNYGSSMLLLENIEFSTQYITLLESCQKQ